MNKNKKADKEIKKLNKQKRSQAIEKAKNARENVKHLKDKDFKTLSNKEKDELLETLAKMFNLI